jgi:hypothetical protein
MADRFDFPADLVDAQRAFLKLEARCEEIAATHPRPTDVAAGRAEIIPEQHAELAAARAELLRLAEVLAYHEWWSTTADRTAAKRALREAARLPLS